MSIAAKSQIIETIAGSGQPGYGGDGGPATGALLNEPKGVAVDAQGNLYIADSENHLIRKVDRHSGFVTTIAGTTGNVSQTPSSNEEDPRSTHHEDDPFADTSAEQSHPFLQVADLSGTVRFVTNGAAGATRFAGDGGAATRASLNFPSAVAVDADGNVYIADTMNHRVRMVEAATGFIRTIAGTGHPRFSGDGGPAVAAGLHDPSGIVIGQGHLLYIADQSNNRIRVVDLKTGVISTLSGNGIAAYNGDRIPALEASLAGPSGLALGPDDQLYVADTFNGRIRAVDLKTGTIETVAGDGGEYRFQDGDDSPSLARPYGIAFDRHQGILITDSDSHLLRSYDRSRHRISRLVGTGTAEFSGDGAPARQAGLNYPFGVAVDGEGTIFIADTFNHRIRRVGS
jgi:sugar lactone lactonase YvrE